MKYSANRRKRIVVTGCTGFVGRQLVPELESLNTDLLLVGRDTQLVMQRFPGHQVCDYASLEQHGMGYDALVHLAVVNNDSDADEAEFDSVNVSLAVQVAKLAQRSAIPEFFHVSSFHALDSSRTDRYSRSKRAATAALRDVTGIGIINLYLPAVYGGSWSGRLRYLNKLPNGLSHMIFRALAAWRPTVHVREVALFLAKDREKPGSDHVYLADDQDQNPFYRLPMRILDLSFAIGVLLLLGWFLFIIWAFVRLDSRGPGLFSQTRVGRAGKAFKCYKFRTMQLGTRHAATHEVTAASVTRMGKLLRGTKLDELPQALNILRNEVSLIGPRPCLPLQDELVGARQSLGVLSMRPGITGLAQINGIDMSDPMRLARVDAQYKAMRSIPFDLRIAVATFFGRGRGDKIGVR